MLAGAELCHGGNDCNMSRDIDKDFGKRTHRRRFRFVRVGLIGLVLLLAIIGLGVPLVLQNRNLAVSMINRYGGLAPMHVDLNRIEVGWLQPVKVHGLRLIDDQGANLVQVSEIETELTLLSLLSNYQNLRTITVRGAEIHVDVQPGTTNIEEALKPFLASTPPTDATDPTTAPAKDGTMIPFQGRIRIADAVVNLRDSVDLTTWALAIKQADVPMPTVEQPIPPMTLIGTISQTNAAPGEVMQSGQFNIKTEPLAQPLVAALPTTNGLVPLKMGIATNGLPLHWYSLIKRRFPEIPIESIAGSATVDAEIELHNQHQILAQIRTAQLDSLQLRAPELVGKRGAAIQQIKLAGTINKGQDRISTNNLKLASDVGTLSAIVDMPLEPNVPTLTSPWLLNTDYEINGSVDLARVIHVAPDLLQMQDQVELKRGEATLVAVQRRSPADSHLPPSSRYQVKLGGLEANMGGTNMRWEEALNAVLDVKPVGGGQPSFVAKCTAEFCDIQGEGDLLQGKLSGSFDLAKMHQRLSQWFALPLESLAGSAECGIAWRQNESKELRANGTLRTTPVRMITQYGQLNEPAWEGDFEVVARIDNGTIAQIDRTQLNLNASGELLAATIHDPISLAPQASGVGQLPAAGVQLKLSGDLDGWMRRAKLFAGIDLGIGLGGECDLEAKGVIDASHVEITQAKFNATKFYLQSGQTRFAEPQVVGNFQGRVNSQDIARLQVDNLLIQTLSFALQGRDEAGPDGTTRIGQAGFRVNPTQLLSAIQTEGSAPSNITVDGDVTGQLGWQIDPAQLTFRVVADGKNIRALQHAVEHATKLVSTSGAQGASPEILWQEPQAKVLASGRYNLSTGQLDLTESQLQTEWFAYGGNAVLTSNAAEMKLVSKGNVTYDAAQVTERMRPWTGSYLAVSGQRTQPLEVTWTSNASTSESWAKSLQAQSNLGWDSANVIGIPIGKADVPIRIENGHFLSKTEIPVSQGTLRWNLDGNVAADPIAIVQAPETVIENVAITPQMCQGWLKFVAPLLADVTSVQGNLSLRIDEAVIVPTDLMKQTAKGQLTVHGANVGPGPLADQILVLVQQIRNFRKGIGATDGGGQQTSWLHMPEQNIGFNVQQGRVAHQNMQIQAGDVVINTSGTVGIDGSLELIASVPIQADWVQKAPALQSLAGQPIQIPLRGTVQKPQMDFAALSGLAQQVASAAIQSEAQKQIEKGMNKLLGPLSNQLAPIQQGAQQMQQGIQQNLPQLQLPNLQNLQIPGFGGAFGGQPQPQAVPPQQ